MIVFFTGVPGCGKSYALMCELVDAVESGKVVATNMPLVDGWARQVALANPFRRLVPGAVDRAAARFERLVFVSEDFDELMRVCVAGEGEERGVMILDELHRKLNSRTWDADLPELVPGVKDARLIREASRKYREKIVAWFSGHRHYGWKVLIGVQDAEMIDRQVRVLGEYFVVCRNAKRFRIANIPLFPVHVFLQLWCWNDRKRTIVRRRVRLLRKRIARLYGTHALAVVDAPEDAIWMPRAGSASGSAGPGDVVVALGELRAPVGEAGWLVNDESPADAADAGLSEGVGLDV